MIKIRCAEDTAVPEEFIEQDRFYDFLVGLNPKFDKVNLDFYPFIRNNIYNKSKENVSYPFNWISVQVILNLTK